VLTQIWFPFRYWDYANHFQPTASWLVFARDAILVLLFAVLVTAPAVTERARAPARS
jgi:hypothetical protein